MYLLTAYIDAAMHNARYEILPDEEEYIGTIDGLQGVWAHGATLESCREELQEMLEEWIVLGLKMGHPIRVLHGNDLNLHEEISCQDLDQSRPTSRRHWEKSAEGNSQSSEH